MTAWSEGENACTVNRGDAKHAEERRGQGEMDGARPPERSIFLRNVACRPENCGLETAVTSARPHRRKAIDVTAQAPN